MSYAMARLKADRFERYRSHDPRVYGQRDERALRRTLENERHRALIGPDGAWRCHVDVFLAERDGDTEKATRLKAQQAAEI